MDDTEAVRSLVGRPSGATFLKVDLHVHTPASRDMDARWVAATPPELVQFALARGLDVIAITDHNNVDWCDAMVAASQHTPLTVLPGVEISTKHGHLLAIFGSDVPADRIRELLVVAELSGTKYGDLNAASPLDMNELARKVDDMGGIAIAAHVDSSKGLMRFDVRAECFRIAAENSISAFETSDARKRETYLAGTVAGITRKIACVSSSDSWPIDGSAHQLDAVGNRFTFLKLDGANVQSVRQALLDPTVRVRFSEDDLDLPYVAIEGFWVNGGFLHGQEFRLNPNLTCLIGATGSGKSFALELLRFALAQPATIGKIAREVDSLLQRCLGERGLVSVVVRKGDTRYLVQRLFETRTSYPSTVMRLADGSADEVDVDVANFFPIKAYSQSEIIEFARERAARRSLTDDLIDISTEQLQIASTKANLTANAQAILDTTRRIEDLRTLVETLPGVREEIERITEFINHPGVVTHKRWTEDGAALEKFADSVAASYRDAVANPTEPPILTLPLETANPELFEAATTLRDELFQRFVEAQTVRMEALRDATGIAAAIVQDWRVGFQAESEEYERLLRDADTTGAGLAPSGRKLTELHQRERELMEREAELAIEMPVLQQSDAEREQLLTQLQDARRQITSKRGAKASQLTATLQRRVVLEVEADGDSDEFQVSLEALRVGSYLSPTDIKLISEKAHPVPFVTSLMRGDYQVAAQQIGIDASKLQRFYANVIDKRQIRELYDLQLSDTEDLIHIRFAIGGGNYRSLEALAHGQKCTVILMVAMAEGQAPLIVDQPEDALHPPYIEENIVATLRERRGQRQYVFATRNANILVSGDAEQVIVMDADADIGRITQTGCVDQFDTRDSVVHHLEGGREAFVRKRRKYGLDS